MEFKRPTVFYKLLVIFSVVIGLSVSFTARAQNIALMISTVRLTRKDDSEDNKYSKTNKKQ